MLLDLRSKDIGSYCLRSVSTHSLKMSRVQMLRVLVNERLTAAVEEIFGIIEETIEEYEEEIGRQRRLLQDVLRPEIQINKADSLQLFVHQVEHPPAQQQQQEWSPSLNQEDPDPLHIKEEQEELWTSQEGEQFQGLGEADITKFQFSPVPVKSENNEEKRQSSQAEPLASTSTEQMKMKADREDYGVSDPASDVELTNDGQLLSSDFSEIEREDIDGNWKEASEPQSGLDTLENNEILVSYMRSAGERPFCCIVCGKRFSLEEQLDRHVILHSENKLFSCPFCGKGFNKKGNMQVHMRRHTGERPFSCSVCGKSFDHKGNLQAHMRRHTGEKPFSCTVCGRNFSQSGALVTHMRRHTLEKPFSCSVCGKRFSQSGTLGTHMRSHTGDKPFSCSVCGKRFSQSGAVGTHMRSHTAERPFSCSLCGKSFKEKGNLNKHMRIHTGEKPYSCSVCCKSFSWLSLVKRHKCGAESNSR